MQLPRLLDTLQPRVTAWLANGFAGLREDWERRCAYIGQQVLIEDGRQMWQGTLAGFGESGELILEQPGGKKRVLWSGDVVRARPLA
jgi:biotin-(acetyl-CoA carboxylase) ligase